ncbi:MAG: DUF4835 family protein [bacterium]
MRAVKDIRSFSKRTEQHLRIAVMFGLVLSAVVYLPVEAVAQIKVQVHSIIDKLPLDDQEKMRDFHQVIQSYIENVQWFEEDDSLPVDITVQMFLKDIPSNVEDRYKCEFLISSSDVQYFDRRVRFAYTPGDQLTHNEQNIGPLTGIIDFYMNMILGSEFDKVNSFGGDVYYKRALSIASLGKFIRTEFIYGWTEREELIKKIFQEPFTTFRKMKDYYFYGLYVKDENLAETRDYLKQALDMIETVIQKKKQYDEPKQFLNAHYLEYINIFKDDKDKKEVFKKLKELDPDHKELYEEQISDS